MERYANNEIEADYSRLKSRLRPMLGIDINLWHRIPAAFTELAHAI
jgi:hypothetical protein